MAIRARHRRARTRRKDPIARDAIEQDAVSCKIHFREETEWRGADSLLSDVGPDGSGEKEGRATEAVQEARPQGYRRKRFNVLQTPGVRKGCTQAVTIEETRSRHACCQASDP